MVEEKRCPGCSTTKPASDFCRSSYTKSGLQVYCKACAEKRHKAWRERTPGAKEQYRQRSAQWRAENPEKAAANSRRYHYGVGLEEYNAMLVQQGHRCAICFSPKAGGKGGFHVDHCHETGKVRGLLCHNCNVGLGNFKHRTSVLEAAIRYLSSSEG